MALAWTLAQVVNSIAPFLWPALQAAAGRYLDATGRVLPRVRAGRAATVRGSSTTLWTRGHRAGGQRSIPFASRARSRRVAYVLKRETADWLGADDG
jgi:hypothetical protein